MATEINAIPTSNGWIMSSRSASSSRQPCSRTLALRRAADPGRQRRGRCEHLRKTTAKPALHDPGHSCSRSSAGSRNLSPARPAAHRFPRACMSPARTCTPRLPRPGRCSELGEMRRPWQLLVASRPASIRMQRGALGGWEATPHQRFERLLRETGVSAGVLMSK